MENISRDIEKVLDVADGGDSGAEMRELLRKNLEMTEEVYHIVKKVNRTLVWQQVFGFVKILIIVVPLIIGLIYLPPLLSGVIEQYQELLGPTSAGQSSGLEGLKNLLPRP